MFRFMKGACCRLPVSRSLVQLWDLLLVLDVLSNHPFEPLETVGLKIILFKTALLLASSTAKRVNDLQVYPSCLYLAPGQTKVCLQPNPTFVPKVMCRLKNASPWSFWLFTLHDPPLSLEEDEQLHTLCPVSALGMYVKRTAAYC